MTVKKSNSEGGHAKNVANFEDVLVRCIGLSTVYNPSSPELQIGNLQQLLSEGRMALDRLIDALSEADIAINNRKILFNALSGLTTKVVNAIGANGVSAQTLEDARGIQRKITGARASKKNGNENTDAETETNKDTLESVEGNKETNNPQTRSSSQQSFDLKVEHFARLVALTQREPTFNPNESELQVPALQNKLAELREANTRAAYAISEVEAARRHRNHILYDKKTGICACAKKIKMYVKSAVGATNAIFKQINRIPFKVIKTG
ncbi:MAG: hypothetical protein IPJ74_20585 [Saprospiraceae bacterium]|nr:hypothetical protein [Saprospiraceae bacterium]